MNRLIKSIVLHCLATPNGQWFTAGDIDKWHKARGFHRAEAFRARINGNLVAIGYHFVILTNGVIATGRHLEEVGAHAQGFNNKNIGICLIGTDRFSLAQWNTLRNSVISLQQHIMRQQNDSAPLAVVGHRDLPGVKKTCPGFSVADWLESAMQPPTGHVLADNAAP